MNVTIFILLAFIGGILGKRAKLPAGALLGSMILVGLWQMLDTEYTLDSNTFVNWSGQCLLGVILALKFKKESLLMDKRVIIFILTFGLMNLLYSFFIAIIIHKVSTMSYITALVSVIPGGFAEMIILAESLDEDVTAVAFFHILRLSFLLLIVPRIILHLMNKKKGNGGFY